VQKIFLNQSNTTLKQGTTAQALVNRTAFALLQSTKMFKFCTLSYNLNDMPIVCLMPAWVTI